MSLRLDFVLSFILGLRNVLFSVLCHLFRRLFRCFDSRFEENIYCHPAFVIRDIETATQRPFKIQGERSQPFTQTKLF